MGGVITDRDTFVGKACVLHTSRTYSRDVLVHCSTIRRHSTDGSNRCLDWAVSLMSLRVGLAQWMLHREESR